MDKDSKGQRKIEDSGGGLLPAVDGHILEWNRTEQQQTRTQRTNSEQRAHEPVELCASVDGQSTSKPPFNT